VSQSKEAVKVVVTGNREPRIHDLIAQDDVDFSLTKLLLSKLVFAAIEVAKKGAGTSFSISGMTEPLLTIESTEGAYVGVGPFASILEAFLLAIRIHEVESYEWVNLPFSQREGLMEKEALKVKMTSSEFRDLASRWIS